MNRLLPLFTLALVACSPLSAAPASARPHVLLICVDDLKPTIGAYGDRLAQTPSMDRLAARGVLFENTYCNQAVCAASRNNLLVGSRSTTLGIYNLATNFRRAVPDAVTLPQYFMQHGYRTEGMGKIFHVGHGNTDDDASWSLPFKKDKVIDYALPESTGGQLTREEAFFSNARTSVPNRQLPRGAAWENADLPDTAYADSRIADAAIQSLRGAKQKPDQPLFLAVGFVRPHLPFSVPKKYWDLYDRAKLPLATQRTPPAGAPAYAGKTLGELNQYTPIPDSPPLTEEHERTLIHGYYASVSYMDAQLGRVLDELDRLALTERTIIIFWSDHGWHLGDHGMWTKHTNYEQANRIPLLISAPGLSRSASRTKAMAETVDLYPTLCELAGLPAPKVPQIIDGRSLVPVLRDPGTSVKDHVVHCFPKSGAGRGELLGRALRTARHRLVEWKKIGAPADTAEFELYDYETDPLETKNLAATQPEVVTRLRGLLAQHPEPRAVVTARP
jgi:iduronate 2-sulfatase